MLSTHLHSSLLPPSPLTHPHHHWIGLKNHHSFFSPLLSPLNKTPPPSPKILAALHPNPNIKITPFPFKPFPSPTPSTSTSTTTANAGRSKKKNPPTTGRIEGNADIRRQAKLNARRRSRRLAQNLFYRRNNPSSNHPDSFSDAELQAIGLGYDRAVRFMSKDDPNLRHPYDWYKYGKYGPYSWRGIVVGPPIRGRFSDDRVSLIGEVQDQEEWEKIEQFDMSSDFSPRLQSLDACIGFKYYWVFVRHPKWRPTELPWEQWTLVCEVALESGKDQRLDKWSLMGRLGNKTRTMVTQCAAWQRPDIIYVKKPVYQCRFEPQDGFFKGLMPLLDPETEGEYLFEARLEDGRVEVCSYFGGLCKIVRVSPKSYVDDVVNAYERLSDEGKSRCLEYLLGNHPMELLHPWTREWKAKLEEMELGCDAPDDSDEDGDKNENQFMDWDDDDDDDDDDDNEEEEEEEEEESEDDGVIDVGEEKDPEESVEYWNEQWKKAVSSAEEMEKLVVKSIGVSDKYHKRQMVEEEMKKKSEEAMRNVVENLEQVKEDQVSDDYRGSRKDEKKRKIPPELFLRAAVRPFTYRNLVKEIVLMRHALVDGDIKRG